ncbi:unnamed protein product [Urochloa humidicola]
MAAVNFDLKFTYVLAGWEGSAHDALILADAIERNDGFTVPADDIVPAEEDFLGDLAQDDLGDLPLEEPAMVTIRDEICNAMWAARGSSRT